jgi:hypothetical protein
MVACLGQRDRQPAGADAQLEDRALGAIGKREVEIEIAGVVGKVEVVQARECGRGGGVRAIELSRVDGQRSQRTVRPDWRLTASALMASRAARLAAIAVVSAWS